MMAPLYNTIEARENSRDGFLLIVFTLYMARAWKTRTVLWIPGLI